MKLIDDIKAIVEDEIGVPFMYQSFLNLNNWMDGAELPCVACQQIINGKKINEGGQLKNSADFLIMFIDKTEFAYTALENQVIIDENDLRVDEFIRALEKSTTIMYVGEYTTDPIYNEFDIITTGVALRITLKERAGTITCF